MMTGIEILLPIATALVEVVKKTNIVDTRYLPVVSVIIGIGLAFLTRELGAEVKDVIINGLVIGLGAVGIYSGVKNTLKK